jgi:hypothetical protein
MGVGVGVGVGVAVLGDVSEKKKIDSDFMI